MRGAIQKRRTTNNNKMANHPFIEVYNNNNKIVGSQTMIFFVCFYAKQTLILFDDFIQMCVCE